MNNTIYGTKWNNLPETGDVPLVADISSMVMSEEIDVSKFGLLFAGAQKNLGPAGVTLVIVREDLIGNAMVFARQCSIIRSCGQQLALQHTADIRHLYHEACFRMDKGTGRR